MSTPVTLDEAKAAVTAAAVDDGVPCPTCPDGRLPKGGQRVIHTMAGGLGADWTLDAALEFLGRAEQVGWTNDPYRHDLAALADGRVIRFDVPNPNRKAGA